MERFDPRYGRSCEEGQASLRLDAEQLQEAVHLLSAWDVQQRELALEAQVCSTSDPFSDCPICQSTYRPSLDDGAQGVRRGVCACMRWSVWLGQMPVCTS